MLQSPRVVTNAGFFNNGGISHMLPSLLLAFREGLEAALIIGIVFAALQKVGRTELKRAVWFGSGLAFLIACLTAIILFSLGVEFSGKGEMLFEGTAMLLAVLLLTFMIFWMSNQSKKIEGHVAEKITPGITKHAAWPIFWLAFLAVLREGVELVLFLLAASFNSKNFQTVTGALIGLLLAVAFGVFINSSSKKISIGKFFRYTNILMVLFAAGLFAHSMHEFAELGWLPTGLDPLYNITPFLSSDSFLGGILHTLFGYNPAPMLTEVVAYLIFLILLIILTRVVRVKNPRTI